MVQMSRAHFECLLVFSTFVIFSALELSVQGAGEIHHVDQWSECSVSCGTGFRTLKTWVCVDVPGRVDPCPMAIANILYQFCNTQPCPDFTPVIEHTPWSSCSVTCGRGQKRRQTYKLTNKEQNTRRFVSSGVLTCDAGPCPGSLIGHVGNNVIPDSALNCSSYYTPYGMVRPASQSRLGSDTCWAPQYPGYPPYEAYTGSWLQADLGNSSIHVYSIQTQGSNKNVWNSTWFVTQYYVMYGNDTITLVEYQENAVRKVFNGNTDVTTIVTNYFNPPLTTRFVRVVAVAYVDMPGIKWDLLGYK